MATFAITGASGFVGTALVRSLQHDGHRVLRLVRGRFCTGDAAAWDPARGTIDAAALATVDVVVHLAGENISRGRWTRARKQAIRDSRIQGTTLLARTLAGMRPHPKVLISASAVGYYGNRGVEELHEQSDPGRGFLAEVAQQWEQATRPARDAGLRVVLLRTGVVLGREGGALARLLLPFQLGLGGRLGSGAQYMSWIALPDVVAAIRFCADHPEVLGPVNVTAPHPATNREFTQALGRVLHRPTLLRVPGVALKLLFGELADAILLGGQRARPDALVRAGFKFQYPELEGALQAAVAGFPGHAPARG